MLCLSQRNFLCFPVHPQRSCFNLNLDLSASHLTCTAGAGSRDWVRLEDLLAREQLSIIKPCWRGHRQYRNSPSLPCRLHQSGRQEGCSLSLSFPVSFFLPAFRFPSSLLPLPLPAPLAQLLWQQLNARNKDRLQLGHPFPKQHPRVGEGWCSQ